MHPTDYLGGEVGYRRKIKLRSNYPCSSLILTGLLASIWQDDRPRSCTGSFHKLWPRHDGGFDGFHRHRVRNRAGHAVFREWIDRLHVCPRILGPGAIEHVDAKRQVVAGEAPRPQDVEVLGADAVPGGFDRTGIGELSHLDVGAAVAQHFDPLGAGTRMTRAIHHEVGAESADNVAHAADALGRRLD